MKIKYNKYAIVTKEKPMEFIDENLGTTYDIEEAMLNDSDKITNNILKTLVHPEEYEVLHINITYEM